MMTLEDINRIAPRRTIAEWMSLYPDEGVLVWNPTTRTFEKDMTDETDEVTDCTRP